jgi:two-component system, OmpR family, sensor histidine kinase TctE
MANAKSLKYGILSRLVLPLILFISVESALSYLVTLHYVDKAYDNWLLDSANSLAQEIKVRHAQVLVELPLPALEIVRWDDQDKTYFKIISEKKGLLAGDNFVPEPKETNNRTTPIFFDSEIDNQPVRVVSLIVHRPDIQDKFYLHVAETLNKRRTMMKDIFLADLIPQVLMVVVASYLLYLGLSKGLKPLKTLANEVAKRSPTDLSPISEVYVLAEARALTDTINNLFKQLSEAIAAQQRFVASAAHQLRTPLAGFIVQAERAAREEDVNAMRPALYQMQKSVHRLSHTVNQLLVLAKSEPIDGMYEFKLIDLRALVKTTCMEWAPKALERRMDISYEEDCEDAQIKGDESLLRELIINLLENAIQYGKESGHITVTLSKTPALALTVEDDGPGIPIDETKKIFDRFYRIPGSPGTGCGLGLAIVKEIANLHNVTVKIISNHDKGGTKVVLNFSLQNFMLP